jgi:predicted AAA+ superfamily ATPase
MSLLAVWDVVLRRGGTPVGQAAVAREAGLANNTVAAGYLELLADLMCLGFAHAWDADRQVSLRRKRARFPPLNLLAAVAFDAARLRSVADFRVLPGKIQGRWFEWLVAQEVARRAALRGEPSPEMLNYWAGGGHEVDYVLRPDLLLEVELGGASPLDFAWFPATFPGARLTVITSRPFDAGPVSGVSMEDLLRAETW